MSDATTTDVASAETAAADEGKQTETQTVSQADVDRIVKERVARERAKYADYDDLKAKAEGSKTLEERLAAMETELTTTKTQALKTSIAAKFGISTEPGPKGESSDADLFLTGSDADSLTAQAQRLAGRDADRKKQGNVAPKEGSTKSEGTDEGEHRSFARSLFGGTD
jgi:hypothetical protein